MYVKRKGQRSKCLRVEKYNKKCYEITHLRLPVIGGSASTGQAKVGKREGEKSFFVDPSRIGFAPDEYAPHSTPVR